MCKQDYSALINNKELQNDFRKIRWYDRLNNCLNSITLRTGIQQKQRFFANSNLRFEKDQGSKNNWSIR